MRFDALGPALGAGQSGRTVVGPSLRVGGVVTWLAVVGLALGAALLVARRRRLA